MKKTILFVLVAALMAAFTGCKKETTALVPEDINTTTTIDGFVYYIPIAKDGTKSFRQPTDARNVEVEMFVYPNPKEPIVLKAPLKNGQFHFDVPVKVGSGADIDIYCSFEQENYDPDMSKLPEEVYNQVMVTYGAFWGAGIHYGENLIIEMTGHRIGVKGDPDHQAIDGAPL